MIEFRVDGEPIPQGSMRAMIIARKGQKPQAIIVPGGSDKAKKLHKAWRNTVKEAAERYMVTHELETLDEPVEIFLHFYVSPVASDPFRRRHATTPDWDKLSRSICDSLTDSKLIRDDGRICDATVSCRYTTPGIAPGVRIVIFPRGAEEAEWKEQAKAEAKRKKAS